MISTTSHAIMLDGSAELDKSYVGGKAFSINAMVRLGLPVPPAFVLPTTECAAYDPRTGVSDAVWADVQDALRTLEQSTGRQFGRGPSPLLVSVRSGAAQSMPGMMDTVLNLGLTAELAQALGEETGDHAWATDTWNRFCESYSTVVLGGATQTPPSDSHDQLRRAIGAVFASWGNERATAYRNWHGLDQLAGTAVTVQAMVFGNRDADSGTGVLFSRDPATGEDTVTGDWLARAQGEEVVSGARTPATLAELGTAYPKISGELERIARLLEDQYRDLVDVEFTIESGQLYILQARVGKRTPNAAARIAVEMVRAGKITTTDALDRICDDHAALLSEQRELTADATILASGTGIGTGIATGLAVADLEQADRRAAAGEPIILVRPMTSPQDVPTMFASAGVVTEIGGAMSHAALVCREIGLPCVVGCGEGTVDTLAGSIVTVDGTTGEIRVGDAVQAGELAQAGKAGNAADPYLAELMSYLDEPQHREHRLAGAWAPVRGGMA